MGIVRTKLVFDVSPEFRERWLSLCQQNRLSQIQMFRRLVHEATTNSGARPQKEGSEMSGFAIVRVHPDDTCAVAFYNRDGLDAFAVERVASPAEAKRRWPGYAWREPTENEDEHGAVVLIGE